MVLRKTIGKRMAAKLKKIRQQLRARLHARTTDTTEWLQSVVRGYFRYHAIPYNEERLKAFRHEVLHMWWWQLRRHPLDAEQILGAPREPATGRRDSAPVP
jgi:hypothetical protein